MSEPTDADLSGRDVPGPRSAPLPWPPTAVPAGQQDGDVTDELAEAYWSVHDGAAAQATVRQVRTRLPKITLQASDYRPRAAEEAA